MKLTCEKCERHFYDLNKKPATCPICGSQNMRPAVLKRAPISREPKRPQPPAFNTSPLPQIEEIPDQRTAAEEDAEDDGVIEDTSDLDDDEDRAPKEADAEG